MGSTIRCYFQEIKCFYKVQIWSSAGEAYVLDTAYNYLLTLRDIQRGNLKDLSLRFGYPPTDNYGIM
jgi:hypothetical protein